MPFDTFREVYVLELSEFGILEEPMAPKSDKPMKPESTRTPA